MSLLTQARALGLMSLGIAATELFATQWLQRTMGVRGHGTLLRLFGLREALSGVGILSQCRPSYGLATGVWSRVAGDVMDLSALIAASRETKNRAGLGLVTGVVLGAVVMDVVVAMRAQAQADQLSPSQQPGYGRVKRHRHGRQVETI